jgi:hypothetical protein
MSRFTTNTISNTYPVIIASNGSISVANVVANAVTSAHLLTVRTAIEDSIAAANSNLDYILTIYDSFHSNTVLDLHKSDIYMNDGDDETVADFGSWREEPDYITILANTDVIDAEANTSTITLPELMVDKIDKEQSLALLAYDDITVLLTGYNDLKLKYVQAGNTVVITEATTNGATISSNATTIILNSGTWADWGITLHTSLSVNTGTSNGVDGTAHTINLTSLANDTHGTANLTLLPAANGDIFIINNEVNDTANNVNTLSNSFSIEHYPTHEGTLPGLDDEVFAINTTLVASYSNSVSSYIDLTKSLSSRISAAEISFAVEDDEESTVVSGEEEEEDVPEDAWISKKLGDNYWMRRLISSASSALEANKAVLDIGKQSYETTKAATIASADPVFFAVNELINLVDGILEDIENLGFYVLGVTPRTMSRASDAKPSSIGDFFYGGEIDSVAYLDVNGEERGLIDGKTHVDWPPMGLAGGVQYDGSSIPTGALAKDENGNTKTIKTPFYTSTKQSTNSSASSSGVTMNTTTGLLQMTPSEVISAVVQAFDDPGDLYYEALSSTGESLYNIRNSAVPRSKTPVLGSDVASFKLHDNKPTFGETSTAGAVLFIIGAPSLSIFADAIGALLRFFDIQRFKDFYNSIISEYKIEPVTVELENVSVKYTDTTLNEIRTGVGSFSKLLTTKDTNSPLNDTYYWKNTNKEPLIVIEKHGFSGGVANYLKPRFIGRVLRTVTAPQTMVVNRWVQTSTELPAGTTNLSAEVLEAFDQYMLSEMSPGFRDVFKGQKLVNINSIGYQSETLLIQPFNRTSSVPTPGSILVEATEDEIKRFQGKDGEDVSVKNEAVVPPDSPTESSVNIDTLYDYSTKSYTEKSIKSNQVVSGQIRSQVEIPKSTPPDFEQLTIKQMIPQYGLMMQNIRTELDVLRGFVKKTSAGLDETIKFIDKEYARVVEVADSIFAIQELFASGIGDTGMYCLPLGPKVGGTEGLKERIQGAANIPSDKLKFCAGILFVGGTPTGHSARAVKDSIGTLMKVLGLKDKE